MKKLIIIVLALNCFFMVGCNNSNDDANTVKKEENRIDEDSVTLGEVIVPNDRERISNQIPEWVSNANCDEPLYVVSAENIEQFDNYAKTNFPDYCDASWTQEQSDSVYLGQGIEIFNLDNSTQIQRAVFYPVILNGVIVSGFQVYEELDSKLMRIQLGPKFVNELNVLMSLTDENTPLALGYNNDNAIAIIGDTYYVLEKDYMEYKEVAVDEIPNIISNTCVNAMEKFCTERTANVSNWFIINTKTMRIPLR